MLKPIQILSQSELVSAIIRYPLVVTPETTVMEAIAQMSEIRGVCASSVTDASQLDPLHISARSSCVTIVEDERLLGILTAQDIVRLNAQGRDLTNLAIGEVMTKNVVTLKAADFTDIFVAVNLLKQHQIAHLPVVDDRHCLRGIVTQTSLLEVLNPLELYNLAETLAAKVFRLEAEKVHLREERTIDLESQIEERTKKLTAKIAQEQLVSKISTQIRASLNLTEILNTAARELQSILSCTRVSIWKFQPDGQTLKVVADWQRGVNTNLDRQVYDPCLATDTFLKGRIRVISDSYTASISDCHRDLLAGLEIRAKILVPIIAFSDGTFPWGLITASESDQPRNWEAEEIALVQQLATQMAIAIRQATAYAQVQSLNTELESRVAQRTAQLQESQQFLQTVVDTFPLAVFWKDRDSRYLGCNHNFAQDANLSLPAEIIGQTDYDLPWIELADAYRADDRQTMDSGVAKLGIVEKLVRADGSSIWLETNKLPLQNLNGETIGILGTYQDITARKGTETQLQQLSKRLSMSLKSGSVGCWEWDIVRDILIWDDRMYEIYGVTEQQPDAESSQIYATWVKSIHPDDRIATENKLAQALLGDAEFDTEFRAIHPDGSIHFIKAYGLVQRDEGGCPQSITGINFDITAAKQDELIRQQAEQTIRQQAERESVLRQITQRIRKSLDLKTIFETAVREIRQFMETDRVAIFKFSSDSNFDLGEFIAESLNNESESTGLESILGVKVYDPNFGQRLAKFYQQGRVNVLEDVHHAGLGDNEIEFLTRFKIQANLVIPLLNGSYLWGFLCIHHCQAPRSWQKSEINFAKQIAEQIGIGIQQATLYEKVQLELKIRWQAEEAIALQLRQQQTLGSIAQKIRNSLNVSEILAMAAQQVKELMMVDRVAIFSVSTDLHLRAVEEVVSSAYPSVMMRNWENAQLSQSEFEFYLAGNTNIVVDFRQDPWSASLQEYIEEIHVKSKIVAPILLLSGSSQVDLDLDTWDEPYLWGLLSIHSCSSQRQWQECEAKLLQQIADQLAIAIHQANLFHKLQQELIDREQAEAKLLKSNQELARATRLKDEFLASMSHELRTPLNAILGLSESLQDGVFGTINDRQRKSIGTIEKSGTHLLALINDILDLSKIEANKFQLELSDVSIQSLCQNSLLFIKELAIKRQIRLHTQLPEQLKYLHIRVDDLRFRQVLINLLSNAVKFTPEGGRIILDVQVGLGNGKTEPAAENEAIVVSTDVDTSIVDRQSSTPVWQIAFSIIDTGIGIAPENMDQLFQSFVQIDSSLSRQYAGTGLGLALVKRIVEMHGGSVSVESEVNRGSCFTVSLPFVPTTEIALTPSPLPYPTVTTDIAPDETVGVPSKTSILLVEDDQGNIETMTTYLQSRGYLMEVAENGYQAISFLEDCAKDLSHHPDIILMDIQMPEMDGLEATKRIRQLPQCAEIPIIALTALAMPEDRQKCLDAGVDQYLAKPVKLSQLVAMIESLLKK